jgi:adenylate kinase family enzyme
MRIAFIGPPGAGKSTQAKRVARYLPHYDHSPRLSSGELVSAEDLLTVVDASRHMGRLPRRSRRRSGTRNVTSTT